MYILQRSKPNADVEERSRGTFTKSIRTAKYLPCPSLKVGALNPFALLTITPQYHSITQGVVYFLSSRICKISLHFSCAISKEDSAS